MSFLLSVLRPKKKICLFLLVFALVFVRYCCYGFEYYHQLDDYIQYHNYAQGGKPFGTILGLGLLAARPLAGCADILIWSRFFSVMLFAAAILSAMLAASACLLQWVFSRHFGTGYFFIAVLTLLPLGFEGTYWVSASSRIAAGLFFASAALYFFERWCSDGLRRTLVLYALTQLAAYGFYEQALVFSLTSVLLLAAFHFKTNRKRSLWGLLSFIWAAAYFIFTGSFSNSAVYGNRLGIITSYGRYYWNVTFPYIKNQISDAFLKGGFYTFFKGAWRGAQMLVTDKLFLYIAAVLLLCAVLYVMTRHEETKIKRPLLAITAGLLLALAPVSIFFVLDSAWFSLRSTVMSFCGIALIADTFIQLAAERFKSGSALTAFVTAGFALICCVASVSELRDYRDTTANDRAIIELIAARVTADGRLDPGLKLAVLNVEPSYLPNQNYYYHEHIHGVTESGWALSGALEWRLGNQRPYVTPMPASPVYRSWNAEESRLNNFDAVYLYRDGGLSELRVSEAENGLYLLFDAGGYAGCVWEENGCGYLKLAKP